MVMKSVRSIDEACMDMESVLMEYWSLDEHEVCL